MKIIIAILSAEAVDPVSRVLVENHFSVTQISSMGGFLRRGSTTLVVGVEEAQLQTALTVLRDVCKPLSKPEGHAATIFVVNASQFVQI